MKEHTCILIIISKTTSRRTFNLVFMQAQQSLHFLISNPLLLLDATANARNTGYDVR